MSDSFKENLSLDKLKNMLEQFDMDEEEINEISDEPVDNLISKRTQNASDAKNIEKRKFKQYLDARRRFEDTTGLEDFEYIEQLYDDQENAEYDYEVAKQNAKEEDEKLDNALSLAVDREFRLSKQNKEEKDESLNEDIGGLTDINDLDLPEPLADTIEIDDNGGVLTLETVYSELKGLKSELTSAIQSIKDTVATELETLKNDIKDAKEVEVLQNIEDEVAELNAEQVQEQPQEMENVEKPEEPQENSEEVVEPENKEEEEPEESENKEEKQESFKGSSIIEKFVKKGALSDLKKEKMSEDLNALKSEVDKNVKEGKSGTAVKNVIELNADNEQEAEEAKKYASEKMTEDKVNEIMKKLKKTAGNAALSNVRLGK